MAAPMYRDTAREKKCEYLNQVGLIETSNSWCLTPLHSPYQAKLRSLVLGSRPGKSQYFSGLFIPVHLFPCCVDDHIQFVFMFRTISKGFVTTFILFLLIL